MSKKLTAKIKLSTISTKLLILLGLTFSLNSFSKSSKIDSPTFKTVRQHMWNYGLISFKKFNTDSISKRSAGRIKLSHELKKALLNEKKSFLKNGDKLD